MKRVLGTLLLTLLPALAGAGWFTRTWPDTLARVHREFPSVQSISPATLAAGAPGEPPLLLDVRTPAEYAVSHLHGAQRAETLDAALRLLQGRPATAPVVVYCSVGWRSSALAVALQQAGFSAVYNLEGGIFTWANEDRPLYRGEQRVHLVHPYNRDWGALLREDLRSS